MSQDHELRALKVFEAALAVPPAERDAYLADTLADAPELRARVELLLAAQPVAGSFF